MCGIFGVLKPGGIDSEELKKFRAASDLVSYRGPDGNGEFLSKDRRLFLAHNRLAILDLSEAGAQPMSRAGATIVYNGEIFNYREVRDSLVKTGAAFTTSTDTEVVLRGYLEYGLDAFPYFNGMWALGIYDRENESLILSRDRFSIKPLYIYRNSSALYFSSEIKQLLPFVEKKDYNPDKVFKFLSQGLLDFDNETFFAGIEKFPPAQVWRVDMHDLSIRKKEYWQFSPQGCESLSGQDVIEKFRDLFLDSIKIRLRSDVPVGILLSGGLDSSSITVVTKELVKEKPQTFSVVSYEKAYSEESFIDLLVKGKNVENAKLKLNAQSALSYLDEVLYHMEEPFGEFSVIAQYTLFKLIKQNSIVVLLSGQGGDELLGGYLKYFFFYLQEIFKQGKIHCVIKELIASMLVGTVLRQFTVSSAKRYIPFLAKRKQNFVLLQGNSESVWKVKGFQGRQLQDIMKYSVPALTHYEDRNSMAHSLEVRHPFLDHRLVEFCLSLSGDYKVKNGWLKYLLRKSIKELPQEIAWRKDKQGFITPGDLWLKTYLKDEIQYTFKNSILEKENIIDASIFSEYFKSFCTGDKYVDGSEIMRTFVLEKWFRKFLL